MVNIVANETPKPLPHNKRIAQRYIFNGIILANMPQPLVLNEYHESG